MANDTGRLAPPNTVLSLADQWFDGNVVVRPGGTFTNNAPTTLVNQAATPTTPVGASVLYSTSGGILASLSPTGQVTTVGGVIQSQSATVTVASTASITALQSYTVPANDPAAGAIYLMYGYGIYSDTGTPTLTFSFMWGGAGGTQLAQVPAITLGSGVTSVPFSYEAVVNFRSTTSALANITLALGTSASTNAASSFVSGPTSSVAVTSTTTNALAMAVTWSASSSSNTISLLGGYVERVA